MTFSVSQATKILSLKSAIASYYSLQMKKINDRHLESFFYDHCVITGGCIASLYHGEKVNDIDVYAKTSVAMKSIKDYIVNHSKDVKCGNSYELGGAIQAGDKLITDNAVTLANDVQFVYLGTADVCRAQFDFVHCMPWYDIRTQKFHISEVQYSAIESKTLVPNIAGESIKARRIQKYIDKGWAREDKEFQDMLKFAFTWNGDPYNLP